MNIVSEIRADLERQYRQFFAGMKNFLFLC